MNRKKVIAVNGVSKSFGSGSRQNDVIKNLSLAVYQGEVFGFLGPNGAGKSTTIKLLLNFIKPDVGNISIADYDVGKEEFRDKIGYLPEFPFFYSHLTAYETLLLSARLSGISSKMRKERIPLLIERMNLAEVSSRLVSGFSKGMKQRLGIANALVHDPDILIFDEPMSGMDPLGRHLIKSIMQELRKEGKTIFFSSHILSDIEFLCDRIAIINKGVLLYSGELESFISSGESLEDRFVEIVEEDNLASV